MGRLPFLTRLALGRSPYEPYEPQALGTANNDVDDSEGGSSSTAPARNRTYVQQYDEGGHAINTRAREYERRLRRAQNDVLAAAGILERYSKSAENHPSQGLESDSTLGGSYREYHKTLDRENSTGQALGFVFSVPYQGFIFCFQSLEARFWTYGIEDASFLAIVASRQWGPGSPFAGFPIWLLIAAVKDEIRRAIRRLQPLERLLSKTQASRKRRASVYRWRHVLQELSEWCLDVAFYPLIRYVILQSVGMVPVWPLVSPQEALTPFSALSPMLSLLSQSGTLESTLSGLAKVVVRSPFFYYCLQELGFRYVYRKCMILCQENIIAPRPLFLGSLEVHSSQPSLWTSATVRILSMLGRSYHPAPDGFRDASGRPMAESVEMDGTTVTNLRQLDLPVINRTRANSAINTPGTPSSSAEAAAGTTLPAAEGAVHGQTAGRAVQHRVTHLSIGPSRWLTAMVMRLVCRWATLPLSIISTRLIVAHYVSSRGPSSGLSPSFNFNPLTELYGGKFGSFGMLASKTLLCEAWVVAGGLGLWGCHCAVARYIGVRYFGWGTL